MILAEAHQQIDALNIEGRREKADFSYRTVLDKRLMHRSVKFQTTKHLVLRFLVVCGLDLVLSLRSRARDQTVCAECLEFDKVGTRPDSGIDQLLGPNEVAIMVDTGFGDNKGLFIHEIS